MDVIESTTDDIDHQTIERFKMRPEIRNQKEFQNF